MDTAGPDEDTARESTIRAADVRAGDVVLVTPQPDEPLGALITGLDGSVFSHSGIALGDGRMASAHTSLHPEYAWDLGGVRRDRFEYFTGKRQHVYRLAVDDPDRRRRALAFLDHYPTDDDGTFSLPKIFIVAAALNAVDPRNGLDGARRDALLDGAVTAARIWEQAGPRRSWYCAELVATAFGERFGVGHLAPPDEREVDDPDDHPDDGDRAFDGLGEWVLETALTGTSEGEARAAIGELLVVLDEHDPDFFRDAARTVMRSGVGVLGRVFRAARSRPVRGTAPCKFVGRAGRRLPSTLVTPRMLRDASWTAAVVERVVV